MRNIDRVFIFLTLLVLCTVVCAAQPPAKDTSASISGRVTISGKPAAGVTIVATVSSSFFDNKTVARTTTDEDGNYKLTGLAAGRFTILPLAKAYLVLGGSPHKDGVNLAEGETITKIDFPLVRGGVVTGRITDAQGRPLIAERVNIVQKESAEAHGSPMAMLGSSRNQTDDRGVYRIYGLAPGSYRVSVGQAEGSGGAVSIMGMGGSQYPKTFYPGIQEEAKATLLEIKEGTELKEVDIIVGKPGAGFSVSGRVVDADSGNPVPNLYVGHSTVSVSDSSQQLEGMNFTGNQTDANGKFRLEGLRPGHYAVYTFAAGQASSNYSEPAPFDISDSDVTGIEIKVRRGATITGQAVIENNSDPAVTALLQTVSLYAFVEQKGLAAPSFGQSQVGSDGSFHLQGLAPGKVRLGIQGFPAPPKGLTLVRTEVDGLDQTEGIEVAAGAQIKGVRLLFAYGTGSIRGDVKIEGGSMPEGTTLNVLIRSISGAPRKFERQALIDSRLHFIAENIPPGTYQLLVFSSSGTQLLEKTVTVSNGTELKLNLTVDLNAGKEEPQ